MDWERGVFRESSNYECTIWGKPAKYIMAEYKDSTGKVKKSALLTSGFWGAGRHMNYTFELGCAFTFCACLGFDWGIWNFLYFFFIAIILFHRIYRDEEKCRKKYGQYWDRYRSEVPYILIPGLWWISSRGSLNPKNSTTKMCNAQEQSVPHFLLALNLLECLYFSTNYPFLTQLFLVHRLLR